MAFEAGSVNVCKRRKAMLYAGTAVLALAVWLPASALAADYTATDDTSLRAAIANANADADASSTITLTNDVTLAAGAVTSVAKPITIDTGSHTLTSVYLNGSNVSGAVNLNGTTFASGASLTLDGAIQAAGAGAGAAGNGDQGLFANANNKVVINNGTLAGGAGGGLGGNGGIGVDIIGASTLTNNGMVSGGSAANGSGGLGVNLSNGGTLVNTGTIMGGDGLTGGGGVSARSVPNQTVMNSGTIQGGKGTTGAGGDGLLLVQGNSINNSGAITGGDGVDGGAGVNITGLNANNAIFTNSGTIQGGTGSSGTGGNGVFVQTNVGAMTNSGSIIGGAGAAAIMNAGTTNAPVSLVNSGTIAAGTGSDTAILMQAPSVLTLELHKGSVIQGNVVANSGAAGNALILGGDDNASFDVSAIGPQYQNFTSFEKTGNSTWALTGTGTASTPWAISQGTLQLGDGGATGSIIGDVTDNAALAFNRSDSFTFDNLITGTGGVIQAGTGKVILTAANTYTGATTVTGGTLSVNGSIAASAVTVAAGGTLGGNGTVGATTIQSGGSVAPGNSIGTLHVNGAFTQNAGSIYQVEVDPTSSASDLIAVNGAAAIADGATLNVTKNPPGNYRLDAQYTVLTASGGVSGNYAASGDIAVSQYLALSPTEDANNIYLRVVQSGDPADAAQTSNQASTATGTDSLPGTSDVGSAVLNTPDTTTTRAAFDALSGEALASAKGVLISSSVLVRDATFDRLRDVLCTDGPQGTRQAGCVASGDGPNVWVQGFGDWGHVYGNANAAGLSQTTGGFLTGVDIPVRDWRLGVFGGYSRTDFDVATRASSGVSDTYDLGAYGGTALGNIRLRLGASYSWSDIDTQRLVAFDTFSNDLRARYNAGTTQVFGEIGRAFRMDRISLEPFANLAYVGVHTNGFSETGGDAALTSRADTTQDTFTTFGVRPSTDIAIGSVSAVLRGMAGWRHTFGDITPSSLVSFAGGTAFTVTGAPIAEDAGVVEAGVSANLSDRAAIGLTYGGQFSNRQTDHAIRGTLTVSF